ncbi:rubrerythrin family protein [Merismopedia glauca]|uniref:Rubrerythrin n=1 Tax=Merismopedia glauca CCAP 1448/3 TaxID=1296344 RepID=A0A2T1BWS2_9CYAN|nr:rubrerythrin family protein [Merismopedia glauca]PSB00460.1 rubrerythrin [Merismopedia glauca CCAP 1448/3]
MNNQSNTLKNLESAFAGESMANRKYLFFAEVAQRLGFKDLAKLFKETAAQETEHAFAHFELLHPELAIADPSTLTDEEKLKIASQCLHLAIEGETYEYTTMYPEFAAAARQDRDAAVSAEFEAQIQESQEHAEIFRRAAHRFGLLTPIEHHHADRYSEALNILQGGTASEKQITQKWICKQCSLIYDPIAGDPDSGIAPGTAFEDISEDWYCPICGATKKMFVPHLEAIVA